MLLFETIAVAFAMFSAIPMPQPVWNERNLRYALCAFPLIGAVCSGAWWAWSGLCTLLGLPALLRAAGWCLLPVVITGGIHLDGYADTGDALASHAEPERKQEILKDSHCGAFAVIRLCAYFIGYFGLCGALVPTDRALSCIGISFILSRSLSGFAVAALPIARNTGLVHTFASSADRKRVRAILGLLALALAGGLLYVGRLAGLAMLAAAGLVFFQYAWTAKREFHGISGDLAGWFLQKAEFWMLLALVISQYGGILV